MQVNPLSRSTKVVDSEGRPTQELNLFTEAVARLAPLVGIGSPEDVIDSEQARFYIDSTGSTGSVLYVKQLSDIGGDRKKGWVLV